MSVREPSPPSPASKAESGHPPPGVPSAFAQGFRNFHAGCCGFVATRPDGSEWPFMMTLHDGSTMHGVSAGVLLAELIAGYAEAGEAERAELRVRDALAQASRAQEAEVERARHTGAVDPADTSDAALLGLLALPKNEPLHLSIDDGDGTGGDEDAPSAGAGHSPSQAPWWAAVPLVLVATTYAPHTDTPRIGGNVRWIDPSDEVRYLRSLHDVGLFDVWMEHAPGQMP